MDDLIKRQDVIESILFATADGDKADWVISVINSVPSAEPKKTGKWIHGREIAREMIGDCITAIFYEGWKCSECECVVEEEREPLWNYCPNCGAKMRGEL